MPELIEVEYYREALDSVLGERIDSIEFPDEHYTRPRGTPVDVFTQMIGDTLVSTSRRGKLLCLHIGESTEQVDTVLGLRFGMTGRLLVDGTGPIDRLEYSSDRNDSAWDRFILTVNGKQVAMRDPRRLGSVELDPDLGRLGVEASTITKQQLERVVSKRTKAIKAVLLDQQLIAGLGNLLVDETLWASGIAPTRPAQTLTAAELDVLASTTRETVALLTARGGSHTGDTFAERSEAGICPKDGDPMRHDTVGGRSTWWCANHQV